MEAQVAAVANKVSGKAEEGPVIGYSGREFSLPLSVDVYRNLQTGTMSVKAREGTHSGKIVAHRSNLTLKDVEFVVRQSGWEDVHRTGKKNVHAVLRGTLTSLSTPDNFENGDEVYYNPRETRHFVNSNGIPLEMASLVCVSDAKKVVAFDIVEKEDPISFEDALERIED